MTTFDYVYGHDFEKPELWKGMKARSTTVSLGFSLSLIHIFVVTERECVRTDTVHDVKDKFV